MSASLVGSEMCIRDRLRPRLNPQLHPRAGLRAGHSPGRPGEILDGSLGPVSYTHLTLPTICSV
eukprot:48130-Alexandrium_andersonii.AAC.1